MENNSGLKYQYHVQLWGTFYNDEYQVIHGEKEGDYSFDTPEERLAYIVKLKLIETELNAVRLMAELSEGYLCNIRTTIHRVIEYKDKRYYSERDMGVNFPYHAAKYHLEETWKLGLDDYPLGEGFDDYENIEIIQEWISGAFKIESPEEHGISEILNF